MIKLNDEEVTKVIIDDDCKSAMSTDMKTINLYKINFDNKDVSVLKEKFTSITGNLNKNLCF